MKPLETNKKVLTWLSICPLDKNANWNQKLVRIAFSFVFIGNQVVAFAGSLTFFLKYVSVDLEQCLYALFQLAAEVSVMYMLTIAFVQRYKITALFDNLSKIYDASKICWTSVKVFSKVHFNRLFFNSFPKTRCKRRFVPIFRAGEQQKRVFLANAQQICDYRNDRKHNINVYTFDCFLFVESRRIQSKLRL